MFGETELARVDGVLAHLTVFELGHQGLAIEGDFEGGHELSLPIANARKGNKRRLRR